MELYRVESLTFTYPGQFAPALRDVSLTLCAGEFVTLCGLSGSGKSTLLRQLKTALAPNGVRRGAVLFDARPLSDVSHREQAERIGFVQQSPENQIVTDKVWHELAFGPESLGYDTPTIRRRVAEMAGFFGMESWFHRETASLSGGQKQLLNLAAVLTLQPDVLILDEPTAQLDPIAAADFLAALARVNRELGTTVLLSEQRLEEALPLSDRAVVLDGGAVLADGAPRAVGAQLRTAGHELFRAMPAAMRVWAAVENDLPCPVSVREGRDWLADFAASHPLKSAAGAPAARAIAGDGRDRLGCVVPLYAGRAGRAARAGADGAAGRAFRHPRRQRRGQIHHAPAAGGPAKALSRRGPRHRQNGASAAGGADALCPKKPCARTLPRSPPTGRCSPTSPHSASLDALLDRHPYDLSGGEQQRAALAKILLTRPDILLLDEPTRGLDAAFKAELAELLHKSARAGRDRRSGQPRRRVLRRLRAALRALFRRLHRL